MKKALTVANIQNQKITRIELTGEFFQAFRHPQDKGVWFIFGGSTSGKSSFVMQLCHEFAKSKKVFYNLLEEDTDDSDFIERTELFNMSDVSDNFSVGQYNYEQLTAFLRKRNSPDVIVIDSATYFFKTFDEYKALKSEFKSKIFIITGHAEGNKPRTELERSIMYDAKQKIIVNGYLAVCKGRTIGPNGGLFIVYKDGYEKARGAQENNKKQ